MLGGCTERSGLAIQKQGTDKVSERGFPHCFASESVRPCLPASGYHSCCSPEIL